MIENTISIDSMAAEAADTEVSAENAAGKNSTVQGNDWQDIEERESFDEQADTSCGNGETTPEQEEKIKLTVYGEEVEVTFEQAKAAAQKGMAFDRMKGQLAEAKNNVHLKALEDIARTKGTTIARLVGDMAHSEEHSRLVAEYGSLDLVPTEVIAQSVSRLSQLRESLEDGQLVQKSEDWSSQLREFMEDNPGRKDIPPQVIETAKRTGSLALAYSDYNARQLAAELERTKAELEMLKAEKQGAKGATPSARSVAAAGEGEDDSFRKMMRSTW